MNLRFLIMFALTTFMSCSNEAEPRKQAKAPVSDKPVEEQQVVVDKTSKLDADAKVDIAEDEASKVKKINGCEVNEKYKAVFGLAYLTAKGVLGSKDDETSELILAVMGLVAEHFNNIQTGSISDELSTDTADLIASLLGNLNEDKRLGIHVGVSAALKALNIKCSEGGLQALDAVSFVVETMKSIPEDLRSDSGKMDVYLELIMEAIEILN